LAGWTVRLALLAGTTATLSGCMSSPGDELASIGTLPPAVHRTAAFRKTDRLAQPPADLQSEIASQAARDAAFLNRQTAAEPNTLNAQAAAIEAYAAKRRQQIEANQAADPALANSLAAGRNIAATETSIYANPRTATVETVTEAQRVAIENGNDGIQPTATLNAARNSIYSGQPSEIARDTAAIPLPDAKQVSEVQDLALAGKDVPPGTEIASADSAADNIAAALEDESAGDRPSADRSLGDVPSYDKAVADVRQKEPAAQPKKHRLTLVDFFRSRSKATETASFDGQRFGKTRRLSTQAIPNMQTAALGDQLPGVTANAMMPAANLPGEEMGEDADDDQPAGLMKLASLPGMLRVAPNGLWTQTDKVDVSCLRPQLVNLLREVEQHYGRPAVVTSGYRNPGHNRLVGGARHSLHTLCAAADIQVEGVSKWQLADYLRSLPGRGGVGTYCHTESVHIDVGSERDWNWRCRRRRRG
jgi:uncharacterized protein YcbK (DUF882 family)